jgi:glycosyltransferase involved in cell wall biosynthesis
MNGSSMHILHIITGLGQGGAESVLYRLATAPGQICRHTVISLTDAGIYGERLRVAGVDVQTVSMARGRFSLRGFIKLTRLIRATPAHVVQTWMYHADLIGGLAARYVGQRAVCWGIRNSGAYLEKSSASARLMLRISARLSGRVPAAIVCCAPDAARRHQAAGYDGTHMHVITNGYDLVRFAPDGLARARVRREWDIDDSHLLIGCVARWDPLKDHDNLMHALAALDADDTQGNIRCVLVGRGMTADNTQLMAIIDRLGLQSKIILAGPRDDIPAVMNALDIHVLSSRAEGFPNVVAEAMACGTPCVVTQVGDAAAIVGDAGWIAPAERPAALQGALASAVDAVRRYGRESVGEHGHQRVHQCLGLAKMVHAYTVLWRQIADLEDSPRTRA